MAASSTTTEFPGADLGPAYLSWVREFSAFGVLITDDKLTVRFCNNWLAKQLGRPEGDLVGRDLLQLFPDLQERGFDRYYAEAIAGQSRVLSHRLHKYFLAMPPSVGVGHYGQMQQSARISPLTVEDQIIGTVTIIEDVTERVVRENELSTQLDERDRLLASELEARQLAEANSRVKDEFLAAVSHEIRGPLNAITGWTKLLVSGELDETGKAHALDTIQRSVDAQARIIEDLLDISRIVAGQMRLDMKPLDLNDGVAAALESVLPAAQAKEIRLSESVPEKAPFVKADGSRLQQILWNLLMNAVKFTPMGGNVRVTLSEVDGFAELRVEDDGQGISPEFLPLVFERFRQEDGGSRRREGGLGLGLSIVKNLVEMHGGVISAESAGVGMGSAFTIMLPLMRVEDQMPAADQPALTSDGARPPIAGCRILIVEDDPDSREMLDIVLRTHAAETQTAANAVEALDQLSAFRPDVVISDLGMPDVDGYDLIRQIRLLPKEKGGGTPAIALSGYASVEERKRVQAAGFDSHLSKPVDFEKLIAAISKIRSSPSDFTPSARTST